jgi:DNA mismatch repair protein MutS
VAALDAFGDFSRAEIASLGGLLDYILLTQVGRAPLLRNPRREDAMRAMLIDPATRANLELTRTLSGERTGSLQSAIDMTVTAGGARVLAERLANPLTDHEVINYRLDEVDYFFAFRDLRGAIRQALASLPDMERALARLSLGRGGPRDLAVIRDGLNGSRALSKFIAADRDLGVRPDGVAQTAELVAAIPTGLADELGKALADELPYLARDGGLQARAALSAGPAAGPGAALACRRR